MTDAVVLAIVAAVPATVIASATLWSSIANGRKAKITEAKVDVIHELTNSNLSALKADLALANQKIAGLLEIVDGLRSAGPRTPESGER